MLLLVLLSLVLTTAAFPAQETVDVSVTDMETGQVLLCRPITPEETIMLTFTHSMYGGEVRETFVPTPDGRLERIEMTTANAAAAEYYAYDAPVSRAGERFRVDVPPAIYDEVVIRVDGVGRHRLTVGSRDLDLLKAAGDGHPVRLRVQRVSVIDRFVGRSC